MKKKYVKNENVLARFSSKVTELAGSNAAFVTASLLVLAWLASGPLFDFSDTWQLVINTSTTIITFLMVFLIQRSQNKESVALHLKLNELVAAHKLASNRLVSAEDMSEEELKTLQKYYSKLAVMSKKDESLQQSHSIEEAAELHKHKKDADPKTENKRQS
jgi:low affinity Fe/Cu permease